jgi:hypothetical protein
VNGEHEVEIIPVDENLEDENLLEMVAVGLLPAIVIDSHKVALWAQLMEGIIVHEDIAINTEGQIREMIGVHQHDEISPLSYAITPCLAGPQSWQVRRKQRPQSPGAVRAQPGPVPPYPLARRQALVRRHPPPP